MNEHLTELRGFLQRDMRRLPLIFAGLFFLFCLIGYAVCTASPQLTEAVVDYFNRMLSDSGLADEAGNISFVGMLMNNWFAMVFTILYGFVPFLFLPVVTAASNALIIGALAAFYRLNQISMAAFFAGIVPHGIFEIPALVLAVSLGFLLCRNIVRSILRSKKAVPMVDLLANILRTMLFVIFPLLLIAALIECYITPRIMSLFL